MNIKRVDELSVSFEACWNDFGFSMGLLLVD